LSALLVLRLRAAYLALFTLGFAEILKAIISAEIEITRGQAGLELPPLFPNGVTILGTFSPDSQAAALLRHVRPAPRLPR
jgi:branched-chain amino acid transport system permease protein